jgi:peptide/nickel transport system substrate-binding protein
MAVPRNGLLQVSRRGLLAGAGGVAIGAVTQSGSNGVSARASLAPNRQSLIQTLTLVTNWPVTDLDPHSVYDGGSALAMSGTFEGLIKWSPGKSTEFEPSLAERWEHSDDRSRWTFHLRPDVTFHDGSPLDAEAVRLSFERLFTLGLAPSTVLGRFVQSIDQISAPDPATVVFDLGRTQLLFESAMATPFGTAILNANLAKSHEVDGDWGHVWAQTDSTGLGTGPYATVRSNVDDTLELHRVDTYWGGWTGEQFEQIVLRVVTEPETRRELIERGDADILINPALTSVSGMQANPDLHVVHETNLMVQYLAMTVAGPIATPEAREALCWAFPYDEVLEGVLLGYAKPSRGPVNENCRGFMPTATSFSTDLDKARALLDSAEIERPLTLSIAIAEGNPEIQAIAELFQANLRELDIELDIQNMDIGSYVALAFGDMPASERVSFFPASWGPDYDDAYNHLWPQVACDAWQAGNAGHFCNAQVDELLIAARDAPDEATYDKALGDVQQILTTVDPAAIYFAQPEWITVLRANISGFVMNPVVSSLFDWYALSRVPNA